MNQKWLIDQNSLNFKADYDFDLFIFFIFQYHFTKDQGLFIAAALTQFDSETESIEDWRYGELIFETYGWGYDSSISAAAGPLDHHQCSDEELGLAPSKEA